MPRVLEDLESILATVAARKGIGYSWEIRETVPPILMGDELRLKQILLNLTGNAVKFTPSGAVSVQARLQSRSEGRARVEFAIMDTGIGIPADKLESIFDSFTQADSSMTRKYGGAGLGLAISKRLVKLMGGTIQAESTPGQGAVFRFDAQFEIPSPEELAREEARRLDSGPGSPEPAAQKNILVVEDSENNRMLISCYLAKSGHAVAFAENGAEGLEAFIAGGFDVVCLDMHMPVMDGYTAAAEMRSHSRPTAWRPPPSWH